MHSFPRKSVGSIESDETFRVVRGLGFSSRTTECSENTERNEPNHEIYESHERKSLQFQIRFNPPDPLNPRSKKRSDARNSFGFLNTDLTDGMDQGGSDLGSRTRGDR